MLKKIGLLAGGVGELSLLQRLEQTYPNLSFVYWGDTARYPLGFKSMETMLDSLQDGLDYMQGQSVDAVILASADLALAWILAYEEEVAEAGEDAAADSAPMLETLFESVGPDYGFCVLNPLPSFGAALWQASRAKKIGLLAGESFIGSAMLPEIILSLYTDDCAIYAKDSSLLGALVMNGWRKRPETAMIVKKHIKPLKDRHIDALGIIEADGDVLLPLYEAKAGKRCAVELYSFTVLDVAEDFVETHELSDKPGRVEIFLTDCTANTLKNAKQFYHKKILPLT